MDSYFQKGSEWFFSFDNCYHTDEPVLVPIRWHHFSLFVKFDL